MAVAGMSEGKAESVFLRHARFKIRPQNPSYGGEGRAMKSILVLSIRDHYANSILDGKKTVELRRMRPNIGEGDIVLIYIPRPIMAVVGGFAVKSVVSAKPEALWKQVGRNSGLTKHQFIEYYSGTSVGFGIQVAKVWRLGASLSLPKLRQWWPSFIPPQGFRYLRSSEIRRAVSSSRDLLPVEVLNGNGHI